MTTGDTWPTQDSTPPTEPSTEAPGGDEPPAPDAGDRAPTGAHAVPRSRRRPQVVLGLAVAVVAAALVAGAVVVATRSPETVGSEADPSGSSSASASPQAAAPALPFSEVRDILARRTAALSAGDQVGFLADLDASQQGFVDRQRRLFTNLSKLPLARTEWSRAFDADRATKALEQQYGAPVYLTWVTFRYQLKGFDRAPVARGLGYTFVQRDGRWWLASDADISGGTQGRPDIWDRTEIAVVQGKRSLVIGTPGDRSRLRDLARSADDAATRDHRLWRATRMPRVVLYVPRDKESRKAYFTHRGKERFDGVEFPVTSKVAGWSDGDPGRTVGNRVVINTHSFTAPSRYFDALVRHEVAHVATDAWTRDGAPVWLIEGAAEYTAYRDDVYGRGFPDAVFSAAGKGRLLTSLPTSRAFYDSATSYDRAYLLMVYIRLTWGEDDIVRLYHQAGAVDDPKRTRIRTAAAIRTVLGVSQQELLRRFNDWAQGRVRRA